MGQDGRGKGEKVELGQIKQGKENTLYLPLALNNVGTFHLVSIIRKPNLCLTLRMNYLAFCFLGCPYTMQTEQHKIQA